MADVHLTIAGRNYLVTCNDGEESHLRQLGAAVDAKAEDAGGAGGGLNESRLLLFSALLLADEIHELKSAQAGSSPMAAAPVAEPASNVQVDQMATVLERLADRIEKLASGLE
jgi:cell division protein ZapA